MTLIAIQKSLFFVRKSTFEVVIPVFFCFVALLTLNVCENNVLNKHALLSKLKPHCKINRILLIHLQKIYIYSCRFNKAKRFIITFKAQVRKIYQLETRIAQFNHKWPIHLKKWDKYIEVET